MLFRNHTILLTGIVSTFVFFRDAIGVTEAACAIVALFGLFFVTAIGVPLSRVAEAMERLARVQEESYQHEIDREENRERRMEEWRKGR